MKTTWMEIETMALTGRGAKTIAKLLDQANRADDRMRRLSDPTLALWAGQSADRKRKRAENMFARYFAQPRNLTISVHYNGVALDKSTVVKANRNIRGEIKVDGVSKNWRGEKVIFQ